MTLGFAYNIFLCFSARLFRNRINWIVLECDKDSCPDRLHLVCCIALDSICFNRFFRSRFFGRTWTSKLVWRSRICVCKLTGISECLLYGSGRWRDPVAVGSDEHLGGDRALSVCAESDGYRRNFSRAGNRAYFSVVGSFNLFATWRTDLALCRKANRGS